MRARGQARSQARLEDPDTGETIQDLHKGEYPFQTHLVAGNRLAKVGHSCFWKRGVKFNRAVLGMESWVELTCNQDDETIQRAQTLCAKMAEHQIARMADVYDQWLIPWEEE